MKFSSAVFEKLLFPLHRQVYRRIQEDLDGVERQHPGTGGRILADFGEAAFSDTQKPVWKPGKAGEALYPSVNITILFGPSADQKISTLYKSADFKIGTVFEEKPPSRYTGSHLQVGFFRNSVLNSFIVPLEYLLGFNEKAVLKEGSHQLYAHTLLPLDDRLSLDKRLGEGITGNGGTDSRFQAQQVSRKNSYIYIGITRRTWQERYKQHCRDAGRGSNLLFHRALRGEFCATGTVEHIVERAGLSEHQAFTLEEAEVENRSLNSLHPKGLNMIPGGYEGLKCVRYYAERTGYTLAGALTADNLEPVLVEVQKANLLQTMKTTNAARINEKIAQLWAGDMGFRIKATTNQHNRFSYEQIKAARIWHACGWTMEKILGRLISLEKKDLSMGQLDKLLKGETYAAIPDILL